MMMRRAVLPLARTSVAGRAARVWRRRLSPRVETILCLSEAARLEGRPAVATNAHARATRKKPESVRMQYGSVLDELSDSPRDTTSLFSTSLVPSYAASPLCSPREATHQQVSPTELLGQDLAKRLAEVEAEHKQAELARRMADVDAESKLLGATKREVEAEFNRCRQSIERAYSSVLASRGGSTCLLYTSPSPRDS